MKRIFLEIPYFIIIVFLASKHFNIDYAFKIYKRAAIISAIFIILQFVCYKLTGNVLNFIERQFFEYRPSSFLSEPEHYAQYITPCIALILFPFKGNEKINFKLAAFLTFSVALSESVVGFCLTLVVWVFWLSYNLFIKKKMYAFTISVLAGMSIISMVLIQGENSYPLKMFSRLKEIDPNVPSSGTLRILKGF
jgi:hypothetical protein